MKQNLFNIESEYIQLMDQIQEAEGEITEELAEALKINEGQKDGKSIAYLSVITQHDSDIEMAKNVIKNAQAFIKTKEAVKERLKERLLECVLLYGEYKVGIHTFGTRKSSSIDVEDVNALPKQYKVVKVTEQADKKALKEALKRGETIEGVELVSKLNLNIK
jgi:hypothetical protein